MHPQYDDFADVYEQTIEGSPIARQNLPFYVRLYLKSPGPVVELGIGSGRIAVEAARRGQRVIGIDNSPRMLESCRRRAAEAGVADSIRLIQADFRDFTLDQPARLIAMPFHTICDIADREDRRRVLRRVAQSLAPGGRFVFDHFTFDPELAMRYNNVPHIEAEYTAPETGCEVIFWTCGLYDFEAQQIRVVAWSDELDAEGVVTRRRYRRYTSCWIETDQMHQELQEAGLAVEALYGDFMGHEADDESDVNVWITRRTQVVDSASPSPVESEGMVAD
jgi:SAM-dependent methyltransferase